MKEDVLSKISEYDIFRYYIGRDFKLGVAMLSPFREEKHASFNVFMSDKGKMLFKDFGYASEKESIGDCFDLVKRIYNVNFHEAVNIIKSDFNLQENKIERRTKYSEIIIKKEPIEKQQPVNFEVDYHDKKISFEILLAFFKDYTIGSISSFIYSLIEKDYIRTASHIRFVSRQNHNIEIKHKKDSPIFVYKYNNEKVRFYRPNQKRLKHFGNIPGDEFFLQNYYEVCDKVDFFIITGGQKDAITLNVLMSNSFATCNGSESSEINYNYITDQYISGKLTNDNVIVFYDDDKVGLKNSIKISKMLGCKYVDFAKLKETILEKVLTVECIDDYFDDKTRLSEFMYQINKAKDISEIMNKAIIPLALETDCEVYLRAMTVESIINSLKKPDDDN